MELEGIAHDKWFYEGKLKSYARVFSFLKVARSFLLLEKTFTDSLAALHTRLRGPLKDRDAPFPIICSLRDSDRELVHAICSQGVYQHPPLVALLVLPPSRLPLFPIPDGVRSVFGKKGNCLNTALLLRLVFSFLPHTHASSDSHLATWGLTFPVSRTGSTQETSTDWGDMTLTLTSWASCSTGSAQNTQTQTHTVQRQKCLAPKHTYRGQRVYAWPSFSSLSHFNTLISKIIVHEGRKLKVPGVVLGEIAVLPSVVWPGVFNACSDTTWTDSDAMNKRGYQARPGFTLWTLKIVQTKLISSAPFQSLWKWLDSGAKLGYTYLVCACCCSFGRTAAWCGVGVAWTTNVF